MKKYIFLLVITLSSIIIQSCGDNRRAKNLNERTDVDDQAHTFFQVANEAGLAEIKAATVAQANSKNQRVINFAKMMVTDHSSNSKELKAMAFKKFVTLKDSLSAEHQQKMDSLSKLSGPAFDKAYMRAMVMDHQKAIQAYHDMLDNKNKDVADYAKKSIPVLQMHLDSAKAIDASLK